MQVPCFWWRVLTPLRWSRQGYGAYKYGRYRYTNYNYESILPEEQ